MVVVVVINYFSGLKNGIKTAEDDFDAQFAD